MDGVNNVFHPAVIQFPSAFPRPLVQFVFVLPETCLGNFPVMFPRMIKINNLGHSVKMFIRDIPYPGGTVSQHTNLVRPVHAAPH